MLLVIRDQTNGGRITNELTLDLLDESITVRELIRSRVYQEVDDFNRAQREGKGEVKFKGLVTPSEQEQALNAPKKAREIDWKKQYDKACEAFKRNGFFILVGDRQAEDLDETITLHHNQPVTFMRLMPLVGG